MCGFCDRFNTDLVERVRAVEGTGKVPRTADGHEILVLREDQMTTSVYSVYSWEVDGA